MLCGVWLLFHEINPSLAPFEMTKWTPFLKNLLGKAFVYQFLGFLTFESYFGSVWNTFAFWWYIVVSGFFLFGYVTAIENGNETKTESLLMHDYQRLEISSI